MRPTYKATSSSQPNPAAEVSVTVPSYNAGPDLASTVDDLFTAAARLGISLEVVVVDDGSTDGAPAQLSPRPGLVVLSGKNQGKGAAIRAGLASSAAPVRGFLDADGEYAPSSFLAMARIVALHDTDAAIGVRVGPTHSTLKRRLSSKAFSAWVTFWHHLHFDTQAGCKVFSAALLDDVLPHLRTSGFAIDVDLLSVARTRNWRPPILVPLAFQHDENGSTVSLQRTISALTEVVRLRPSRLARVGWYWGDEHDTPTPRPSEGA